jgi:hypothetical protein
MDTPEEAAIVRPKLSNMSDDLPAFRKQVVVENLYKHVEYLSVKSIRTQTRPPRLSQPQADDGGQVFADTR